MNSSENNELKKFLLDSMEKKDSSGGYAVPENYFKMLGKKIEERVKNIPNLVSVQKENVFTVPQNYFTQLENAIRENVSAQTEHSVTFAKQWYRRPKLVLVYASVLIFAIATSTYFLSRIHPAVTDKDISFNDIYNSDYVNEMDESSLVALLEETSVPVQSPTQIDDYMIDNNIDISTLTDQL